jgi:protein involved in polysaccharide export with SLBB domain
MTDRFTRRPTAYGTKHMADTQNRYLSYALAGSMLLSLVPGAGWAAPAAPAPGAGGTKIAAAKVPAKKLMPAKKAAPKPAEPVPTVAATVEPPAPKRSPNLILADTYQFLPGDEIEIQVRPRKEFDCDGTIAPDGTVYLDNIGAVPAAGLTVAELREELTRLFSKRLIKPRVAVIPKKLVTQQRGPTVTVDGQVGRPGPVDLEPGMRVRKALEMAGGTGKIVGQSQSQPDLAHVVVLRRDLRRITVDVSTDERAADPTSNLLLEPGDSIFVPELSMITVSGSVTKPGPVGLEDGLRLMKAIGLAGGTTLDADLSRVKVQHLDTKGTTTVEVVDLSTPDKITDAKQNLLLRAGDQIQIDPLPQITVTGSVQKPGPVQLQQDLRVRKAIDLAGGILPAADLSKVKVTHLDLTADIYDLSTNASINDPKRNVVLKPGDAVDVPLPYEVGTVTIRGEGIANAGSYDLKPGWSLEELIVAAGKLTPWAKKDGIQLVRKGQEIRVIDYRKQLAMGPLGKIDLMPGDEVFVPREENVIFMIGPIQNPGARAIREGQKISELFLDGDPDVTNILDNSRVILSEAQLRRNGKTIKVNLKNVLGNQGSKEDLVLQNRDLLFIPPKDPTNRKPSIVDYIRGVIPYLGGFLGGF